MHKSTVSDLGQALLDQCTSIGDQIQTGRDESPISVADTPENKSTSERR